MFARETGILEDAMMHIREAREGAPLSVDEFEKLIGEYRMLLKMHKKVIKISDRASANMITGQKEQITNLADKVHYDILTGIYSRRYLEENLKRLIKGLSRSGGKLSVLMIDIDFFKKYNDTYGHNEGDLCLAAIAQAISGCLSRANDFVARYGGEEFTAVLPDTDEAGAGLIAGKILKKVKSLNIPNEKSEIASFVTVSIGVTSSNVVHTQKGSDYILRADKALYESKNGGRNRYTYIEFDA